MTTHPVTSAPDESLVAPVLEAPEIGELPRRLPRFPAPPRRPRLRGATTGLERHDRPPSGRNRPLRRGCGRDPHRELRAGARAAAGGAGRRPQHRRQCRVRRGSGDRPVRHAIDPGGSGTPHRTGRGRCHLGRARSGDPPLRARDHGRRRVHNRGRRADARRRHRLARPLLWARLRQSGLGGRR